MDAQPWIECNFYDIQRMNVISPEQFKAFGQNVFDVKDGYTRERFIFGNFEFTVPVTIKALQF